MIAIWCKASSRNIHDNIQLSISTKVHRLTSEHANYKSNDRVYPGCQRFFRAHRDNGGTRGREAVKVGGAKLQSEREEPLEEFAIFSDFV